MTMAAGQPPSPLLAIGDLANGGQLSVHNGDLGVAPFPSISSDAVHAPLAGAASNRSQPDHRSITDADGRRDADVHDQNREPSFVACMPDV